jgi:riboflavin kinase/FMN adenylyltransferase
MLGYLYALKGLVVPGWGRGRELGFPTANLAVPHDRVLPGAGIYAGVAYTAWGRFAAATHVGPAPTFDRDDATIEAYLVGFAGDLMGTVPRLAFVKRLRDIVRFDDAESLVEQIHDDVRATEEAVRPWMTKAP